MLRRFSLPTALLILALVSTAACGSDGGGGGGLAGSADEAEAGESTGPSSAGASSTPSGGNGGASSAGMAGTEQGGAMSDGGAPEPAGGAGSGGQPGAAGAGGAAGAETSVGGEGGSGETLEPHSSVRLWGQCYAICKTNSDPDGDGWGYENEASCITEGNPLTATAPWCETPLSETPYEATPSPVNGSTTGVAVLPRPPHVDLPEPTNCPDLQGDLEPWQASYLDGNGYAAIPAGKKVLLAGNDDIPATTLIRELMIPHGSELVLADQPTKLRVRDVMVHGALRIGSPSCRFESPLELSFDTDENVAQPNVRDVIYARKGLGIVAMDGAVVEIFGRLYQPTWTRLAKTATAASSVLELGEPVDWQPGQKLVIVTSTVRDYPLEDQNEVRTIASVQSPTQLTLDAPLAHRHYAGPEYQVEVGLLSRNIVLRTAEAVLAAAPTFGGHVMIHGSTGRVSGVELYGMGQQNFVGRYPLHFHLQGDVAGQSYFTDNSIWRSNYRCAVIHRTDRAIVSRNVAFDVFGHCYYVEDGVERFNEISYNLAAKPKILGPTDQQSLAAINTFDQQGFTLLQSPDYANPADRAAAGFYLTNGNNYVFGNAASGGFAGYSLPNLPTAIGGSEERIFPLNYGASHFNGNSAHSAGYLWNQAGCVYAGGALTSVNDSGTTKLQYQSGRPPGNLNRTAVDVFSNTKAFLCTIGVAHWGNASKNVNLEVWDSSLAASVFGTASIQSAVVSTASGNSSTLTDSITYYRRGFQFYDTWTLTMLRDVVFRGFHAAKYPGVNKADDNCALYSMTHSDQYTPQRMNTTSGIFFDAVDEKLRFCHNDTGTLSSRNFNLIDVDGSATRFSGDGLPAGPRLVGSGYSDEWKLSPDCVKRSDWGLWICPLTGTQNVASIGVLPNQGVMVTTYDLDGASLGQNWYSNQAEYAEAQITAPSGIGWHHAFPGAIPAKLQVYALQVPTQSFVLLSFSLPAAVECSVSTAGWQEVADVASLLAATGPAYTTQGGSCFVRVPPVDNGSFSAAGLETPRQAWHGMSNISDFTIETGCTAQNAACLSHPSTLPVLN